ncbi:uncharacterized protein HRG_02433 [Hirsutella rhossiliensis]|uniref:DUF726-domain-containing protein n=1 Tax=Hirsutella rhossiliensis TaxID=111463 RepID=A0A9P8SM68_9HYPO|nr:uncharacterized protein HRG_02433 [Hirsutella rhossiliensis]KAH0967024.1 hypothetical protein HRG_02433 [Hirsutella rhossiliensis]
MGRGSRGSGHQSFRRPVDLTGVISIAERNDLTTLVSAITDKMHNDVSAIFDSPPVATLHAGREHHTHWLSFAIFGCHAGDKDMKASAAPSSQHEVAGDGSKSFAKAHEIVEKEEAEAMTPQLRELKKEALVFFRKWQNTVIQRTREIHIHETPAALGNPRGRGGRGPRGGFRGRGARTGAGNGGNSSTLAIGTGPPRVPTNPMDPELAKTFPPIPNTLWALHLEKRKILLHVAILLVLSLQEYGANARVLLLHLSSSLSLSRDLYQGDELRVSRALAKTALQFAEAQELDPKPEESKGPRRCRAGLGGGSGLNDSVAVRLKAEGVGSVQNGAGLTVAAVAGLLGPMAEHGHLLGNLYGISPVRPTSKMLEGCCREIQDFAFLRLYDDTRSEYRGARETPAENRRLRLTIAMSGCLSEEKDVVKPWQCLGPSAESYATVIKSTAWASAKKEIMTRSIFSSLMDSHWPVSLLKISKIIDNPWSMGMVRAEKAGALLADAIVRHKFQGERSVSLIGYGLASRAIYTCLMVLAERRQFGLIDSVVMMGTPAPSESRVWLTLKSVVTGRLVNVYSEQDFILGFLYRTSNIHFGVAGLQEIQGAHGVENHCVEDLPRGHLDYQNLTGRILEDIGWEGIEAKAAPKAAPRADRVQKRPGSKRAKSAK